MKEAYQKLLESIGDNQQHAMSLCSKLLQLPQTAHREAVHAASRVAAQRCYVGRWRASMVQRLCELGDREALSLVVASWRKRDLEKLEWRYQDHDDAFVEMQVLAEFADDAQRLGIEALHSFTFNSVADTARWQAAIAAAA